MSRSAPVLPGLLDDAAVLSGAVLLSGDVLLSGAADRPAGVDVHLQGKTTWWATLVDALVVGDRQLAALGRRLDPAGRCPVTVVNSTGAGGLLGVVDRAPAGVQVTAVTSALRDLDDLAQNAARVVAAASGLPDDVTVYVELPPVPGWERAVEVVEAAGLCAAVRLDTAEDPFGLAGQLAVLVEADLPFRTTGWPPAGARLTLLNLLVGVHATIEGVEPGEVAGLLTAGDPSAAAALVSGWDDAEAGRVRRRIHRVECPSVPAVVDELVEAGALSRA